MNFQTKSGELIIWGAAGELRWRGKPEQRVVEWATALPNCEDGVALYHYYRPDHPYGAFENLVRVRADGSIVWRAELPDSDDKYTFAELRDGRLFAYSWGGYDVEIDVETGKMISKVFSK